MTEIGRSYCTIPPIEHGSEKLLVAANENKDRLTVKSKTMLFNPVNGFIRKDKTWEEQGIKSVVNAGRRLIFGFPPVRGQYSDFSGAHSSELENSLCTSLSRDSLRQTTGYGVALLARASFRLFGQRP